MGKLIDITSRLKNKKSNEATGIVPDSPATVSDMTEARQAIMNKDKRAVKRTILSEFVGAFVVFPERGLCKVTLVDISENGVAFDLDMSEGYFLEEEEVAMRVYLNHKTFFPFIAKVTNARMFSDEHLVRHGANFVKGTINDEALYHFVKFIETVSASLKTDSGDVQVSNIS